MKTLFKRLIILVVVLTILVGIPFYFGMWWFLISWFPAIFAWAYLDR